MSAPPWKPLREVVPRKGYASVYLSDDLARYPVRGITRIGDNKSDPNIETMTYGLCSTCESTMRTSIVDRGIPDVFFLCNHRGEGRRLTGRYEIGWFAEGPFHGAREKDFALAAKSIRFIEPIPIESLKQPARDVLSTGFRQVKILEPEVRDQLRNLIDHQPDQTDRYLAEVERLESFALFHTKFRYPSWQRKARWTLSDAERYLRETGSKIASQTRNESPTGRWNCVACNAKITNSARLKACPACGELATLEAVVGEA
jgi:hypothetical protein